MRMRFGLPSPVKIAEASRSQERQCHHSRKLELLGYATSRKVEEAPNPRTFLSKIYYSSSQAPGDLVWAGIFISIFVIF